MGDFKPEHEGWLYKDVERASERSTELTEMSDAQRVDRLRAENIVLKEALRLAVKEIDNHHSDYHHLTPISILKKIRTPLGGMEE